MDIVKKHLVPIICGVIALVCVVLIFYPFGGLYEGLTEEVDASKRVGDQLNSVKNQQRTWPTLSSREEDREPLTVFPTDTINRRGEEITLDWKTQTANFQFEALAIQRNALIPLVPSALPGAAAGSQAAYQFQDAYLNRFGLKINPATGTRYLDQSIFNTILKRPGSSEPIGSGLPPTPQDVAAEQQRVAVEVTNAVQRVVGTQVMNPQQVQEKVAEATAKVAQNMRAGKAKSYVIYVDPDTSLQHMVSIQGAQAPRINDIFEAQVSLWIQEEMCRAIAETNKDAKQGVVDAPIKRLVKMTVQPRYVPAPLPPGSPAPTVPPLPTTKVEPDYTTNPLGQKSNDFFDVIRFDLELVCEAERMPDVLAGLSRGRYVMFRNAKIVSLDSSVAQGQGFLYGNKPVIALSLEGQYLMLREFISPFMPPDIINGLSLQPGQQPGQPGMPGGMESPF